MEVIAALAGKVGERVDGRSGKRFGDVTGEISASRSQEAWLLSGWFGMKPVRENSGKRTN